MQNYFKSKLDKLQRIIEFIKNYRIKISHNERFLGIKDTLFGWALIAVNTVFLEPPADLITSEISFTILFLFGCLTIFVYVAFEGICTGEIKEKLSGLLITKKNDIHIDSRQFSVSQRRHWIYFRGTIATLGYIAYSIAKIYFGVIDNSAIFGADALVYAISASLLLGKKYNIKEWLGILIASFGVSFILFFDITSLGGINGLISGIAGLISAVSITVIFFIQGIVIRHDPPQRVSFHQCLVGFFISSLIFLSTLLIDWIFWGNINYHSISYQVFRDSCLGGVIYASALIFFLRAFLYTEPIILVMLGYSLGIFVMGFEWFVKGIAIDPKNGISFLFIVFGSLILIHQEYLKDKKKSQPFEPQEPLYKMSLKENLTNLIKEYKEGKIDKYTFLSEKHEFNKLLFEFSKEIKESEINCIKILEDSLVFSFRSHNIELETDGGARSVPFEILNFGSYELKDELMSYELLQDGDVILDVGAHIGWYSINFAKRFPNSKIYSFEPIERTFKFLNKNIQRNHITNVYPNNFGCSNKNEEKYLYYFKGGSALASTENLIGHEKVQKVKCQFHQLDFLINKLNIQDVDFVKCDVEGAELFVLEGAKKMIEKYRPIFLLELFEEWSNKCGYSTHDVNTFLSNYDYDSYQVQNGKLVKCEFETFENNEDYNYFFLNKNKHRDLIEKHT